MLVAHVGLFKKQRDVRRSDRIRKERFAGYGTHPIGEPPERCEGCPTPAGGSLESPCRQGRQDVGFQVLGFVGVAQKRKQISKAGSQAAIADELHQQFPYIPWRRLIPEKTRTRKRTPIIASRE